MRNHHIFLILVCLTFPFVFGLFIFNLLIEFPYKKILSPQDYPSIYLRNHHHKELFIYKLLYPKESPHLQVVNYLPSIKTTVDNVINYTTSQKNQLFILNYLRSKINDKPYEHFYVNRFLYQKKPQTLTEFPSNIPHSRRKIWGYFSNNGYYFKVTLNDKLLYDLENGLIYSNKVGELLHEEDLKTPFYLNRSIHLAPHLTSHKNTLTLSYKRVPYADIKSKITLTEEEYQKEKIYFHFIIDELFNKKECSRCQESLYIIYYYLHDNKYGHPILSYGSNTLFKGIPYLQDDFKWLKENSIIEEEKNGYTTISITFNMRDFNPSNYLSDQEDFNQ